MRINRISQKTPATEWRPRGGERIVGSSGDLNASSRQDLIAQIATLVDGVRTGTVARADETVMTSEDRRAVVAERQAQLSEAMSDKTGEKWMTLGETITEEIYEALGREGFTRKILGFKPVKRGDIARIAVNFSSRLAA